MPFRGPSVATFLMQAEENLAALGAQLEGPDEFKEVTPSGGTLSVYQGQAGGAVARKTALQQSRSASARVCQQSDRPEQTCETLHSLEEQLDIQARSLLGIDKRLRGLEGRLRASVEAAGAIAEKHARGLVQEVFHGPMRELEKRVNELQAAHLPQADSPEGIGRREFQVLERKVAEVLLASKRSASAGNRSAPNALVERRLSEIEAQLHDMAETLDYRRLALVEKRLSDFEVQQRSFFAEDANSEDAVRVWMRGVDSRLAQMEPECDGRTHFVARWEISAMEERVVAEHSQVSSEILSLQERVAEVELSVSRLPVRCPPPAVAVGMQDPAALQRSIPPRKTASSRSSSSAEAGAGVAMYHNSGEKGRSKPRSASASSIASGGLCGLSATMRGLGEACGASAPPPGIVNMEVQRLNSQATRPVPVDEAGCVDVELSSHEKQAVATAHASLHRLTSLLEADRPSGVSSGETLDSSSFDPAMTANDRLWPLDCSASVPDYPVSRDLPLALPRQSPFQGHNDRTSLNTITETHVASSGDFAVRGEPRKDSVGPWGIDSEASSGVQEYVMPAVSSAGSPTVPGSTTAASTPPAGPSLSASLSASPPAAEPHAGDLPEVHGGLDPTELLEVFLVELGRGPAEKSSESLPQPVSAPVPSTAGLAEICARLRDTRPVTDADAATGEPLVQADALLHDGSSTSTSPTGSLSSLPM